jgi:hypothetical protein
MERAHPILMPAMRPLLRFNRGNEAFAPALTEDGVSDLVTEYDVVEARGAAMLIDIHATKFLSALAFVAMLISAVRSSAQSALRIRPQFGRHGPTLMR